MTTLKEAKKKIKEKRKEAHENLDKGEEYEGKFSAYTKALNILHKVDEIKISLDELDWE